jgi:cellulose synthase/poly-beta-1,6-N-acetylglucosamine synthase-like glycosyltransferase
MSRYLRYARYAFETLLVNALIGSTLYQLAVYLANRRFWRQAPPPPAESAPPVSAVVPLRGKTLDTLALLHLMAVSAPTADYELLLVLESERDPAYDAARQVAASYPGRARIVLSGPPGCHADKLHKLNAGYRAARGDLIAFIDAQAQVSAGLWHAALAALQDRSVGAVFAPPLAVEPEHRGESGLGAGGEMLSALHLNHAQSAPIPFAAFGNRLNALANGFMVVRRRALDEAGGMLHLLDEGSEGISLGRTLRETGWRIAAIPVPALIVPERESFNEAVSRLRRHLIVSRAYSRPTFIAWPFTNPLTVGLLLGFITEREGRWWGRRTWWAFVALRVAIAHELDRVRFGRGFTWMAYAQLFMLDTFIAPVLWARALFQRTFTWRGRAYRIARGGKVTAVEGSER